MTIINEQISALFNKYRLDPRKDAFIAKVCEPIEFKSKTVVYGWVNKVIPRTKSCEKMESQENIKYFQHDICTSKTDYIRVLVSDSQERYFSYGEIYRDEITSTEELIKQATRNAKDDIILQIVGAKNLGITAKHWLCPSLQVMGLRQINTKCKSIKAMQNLKPNSCCEYKKIAKTALFIGKMWAWYDYQKRVTFREITKEMIIENKRLRTDVTYDISKSANKQYMTSHNKTSFIMEKPTPLPMNLLKI